MSGTGLELAFGSALNLSLVQVFQGMMAALLLGILVAVVYRVSVAGRIVSAAMPGSLIVLAMVGAMVMMVIGNNLARAFSLVGALAIVRFRTRLRSPWDITFVFFALAAGIAAGVGAFRVAVLGTVMVSLAVLTLIRVVGVILAIALMTLPAASARPWSVTMGRMMVLAVALAALATCTGLLASHALSTRMAHAIPTGPVIIIEASVLFVISLGMSRWRRWRQRV